MKTKTYNEAVKPYLRDLEKTEGLLAETARQFSKLSLEFAKMKNSPELPDRTDEAIHKPGSVQPVGSAKPCPFCGHDPIIQHSNFIGSFVECYNPDCYLVARRTGDLDYVLEQWNTRPNK